MPGRITIGLYNSYDARTFREPHRRVLARAGALCSAFNFNLCTFGFPFPDDIGTPRELADWVSGTTSIGQDGGYFVELAEKGRFQSFPFPGKGFPPQLGDVVLTTSKPHPGKNAALRQIAGDVAKGKSILLLFGIGPHGVPRDISAIPKINLDITDGGFSLETCTALGAVAGALYTAIRL